MPPRKRASAAPASAAVPVAEVRAPRAESRRDLTDSQAEAAPKGGDISTEETAAQAARRERAAAQRPVGNDVCCTALGTHHWVPLQTERMDG